jgi:predicted amidohydrolase YtcJ
MQRADLAIRTLLLIIVFALAACSERPAEAPEARTADLVLRNGRIYTVDATRSWAQAVGISNGRIVYVGTDADAEAVIGSSTQVVDLDGRMLLPGFQDIHIHPISGGIEASTCDLNGLGTVDAYLEEIADCAQRHKDEEWITGGGWSMAAFGPGANASRKLLDEIVPDRPVMRRALPTSSGWAP